MWACPDRTPGKGGKFLVLPPGYTGKVPDGYDVYTAQAPTTSSSFCGPFTKTPTISSPAVKLMEEAKVYPLNCPRRSASR